MPLQWQEKELCAVLILFGVALFLSSGSECSRATSSSLIVVDDDSLIAETAPLKKTCSILLEDFFNFAFGLVVACGVVSSSFSRSRSLLPSGILASLDQVPSLVDVLMLRLFKASKRAANVGH